MTLQCQFCTAWNLVDPSRARDRPVCGKCGRPILLDRPYPLTDESFKRTIAESPLPVLVDFYADWCGPCKVMAPAVDALAAARQGDALIAKMNTDFNPNTAREFQIQRIPTTIVFRNGVVAAQESSALTAKRLAELLG